MPSTSSSPAAEMRADAPIGIDALTQPSCCNGYWVCVPNASTIPPRSRMPSAIVVSTAASTDSPVMRRISSAYTSTPTSNASTADMAIATSGCPANRPAVTARP